jgi:O-antigen/teichoic acid export membrane protein
MLVSGSSAASAVLSFARNVLIARLISVEDFGIAATFTMTVLFMELAGNVAVDRLIIQGQKTRSRGFQDAAQLFQVLRGAVSALILFALARPIAIIFDLEHITWAYQLSALYPLIRGLAHLDACRAQRYLRFMPIIMVEVGAAAFATIAAVPLALWLQDFTAVLYLILLQALALVAISHRVARRPYRLRWDAAVFRQIFDFGWPVLIGGFVLFFTQHGDRVIVGAALSVRELGWFSAALMTIFVPSNMASRVCLSLFLPILSKAQDNRDKFDMLYATVVDLCLFIATLYAVAVAIAGPPVFHLLFGARYDAALPLLGLLGAALSLGLARTGPATVAMSRGDTKSLLIANLVRLSALGLAWLAVRMGYGVVAIVVCGLIGEFAALVTAHALLRLRSGLAVGRFIAPLAVAGAMMAGTVWFSMAVLPGFSVWGQIPLAIPVLLAAAGAGLMAMPNIVRFGPQILRENIASGQGRA